MPRRLPKASRLILSANTGDEVLDALHKSLGGQINAMALWYTETSPNQIYYHSSVPMAFRAAHLEGLNNNGSLLLTLARSDVLPFTFSEARNRIQPSGHDHWIFELLRQYGIRDGFYCLTDGWLVVYWSEHVLRGRNALDREARSALSAAASIAVYRMKELAQAQPLAKPALAVRQLMALRHLSMGDGLDAIATALGVTKSTVREHLYRAQKKLHAKTRAQAVAIAIRRHLI